MNLFDNTLRDGGNVVGHGFNAELTVSIVKGLLSAGIVDMELGNCKGLGAYTLNGATKACSDEEYLDRSVFSHLASRLPWLIALMCSYIVTGGWGICCVYKNS